MWEVRTRESEKGPRPGASRGAHKKGELPISHACVAVHAEGDFSRELTHNPTQPKGGKNNIYGKGKWKDDLWVSYDEL